MHMNKTMQFPCIALGRVGHCKINLMPLILLLFHPQSYAMQNGHASSSAAEPQKDASEAKSNQDHTADVEMKDVGEASTSIVDSTSQAGQPTGPPPPPSLYGPQHIWCTCSCLRLIAAADNAAHLAEGTMWRLT